MVPVYQLTLRLSSSLLPPPPAAPAPADPDPDKVAPCFSSLMRSFAAYMDELGSIMSYEIRKVRYETTDNIKARRHDAMRLRYWCMD